MERKKDNPPFKLTVRRCARCGGILISEKSISRGFGPCCEQKQREEEREQERNRDQLSLFDEGEEGENGNQVQ
jgi:hypothetical protein